MRDDRHTCKPRIAEPRVDHFLVRGIAKVTCVALLGAVKVKGKGGVKVDVERQRPLVDTS